jgi:hypothetical protein
MVKMIMQSCWIPISRDRPGEDDRRMNFSIEKEGTEQIRSLRLSDKVQTILHPESYQKGENKVAKEPICVNISREKIDSPIPSDALGDIVFRNSSSR